LWKAVEDGNSARVLELLRDPEEGCVDVDVRYRGWTPLMKAADLGNDGDVRYRGWTPLMKAADLGNVEILRLLLQYQAEVSAVNHKGRRPLDVANCARLPNLSAIKVLLELVVLVCIWAMLLVCVRI